MIPITGILPHYRVLLSRQQERARENTPSSAISRPTVVTPEDFARINHILRSSEDGFYAKLEAQARVQHELAHTKQFAMPHSEQDAKIEQAIDSLLQRKNMKADSFFREECHEQSIHLYDEVAAEMALIFLNERAPPLLRRRDMHDPVHLQAAQDALVSAMIAPAQNGTELIKKLIHTPGELNSLRDNISQRVIFAMGVEAGGKFGPHL